ncbi:MAG: pilus assembly protein PilM [Candidatus Paceibacterota bacterium]|jgi:hypothetical protein
MNLRSIFIPEEAVGGLEIRDTALRLALLEPEKKTSAFHASVLVEEPIEAGIIVSGLVADRAAFVRALQRLVKRAPRPVRYVIVSLPTDVVYTKIFTFPGALEKTRVNETMRLSLGYQLPFKQEDIYVDWEIITAPNSTQYEVALGAILKSSADAYISALESAKLSPVAIEYHTLSLARVVPPINEPQLIQLAYDSGVSLSIIQNGFPRFVRTIPKEYMKTGNETQNLTSFYEVESGIIPTQIKIGSLQLTGNFSLRTKEVGKGGDWLVVLGAAMRGIVPRAEDVILSLMPMGTEQAYAYQRAIAFGSFTVNLIIGLCLFFLVAYGTVWSVMVTVQQNANTEYSRGSTLPVPTDSAALETRAKNTNELLVASANILKQFPQWSILLDTIKTRFSSGILISEISAPSPESMIVINGIAQSRPLLNEYRGLFESSADFINVKMPVTNIDKKENIPFTLSFQLKDPQFIYLHP